MNSNKAEIVRHIEESTLIGDGQMEDGDFITAAAIVLRIERPDDPEPEFMVVHTGDYITATGLLTLAKGVVVSGFMDEDEDGGV